MITVTALAPPRPKANDWKQVAANLALICGGSLIYVIGMNTVLIPARLFTGGVTGVAILICYHFQSVNIGLSYFLLNIPFAILGWTTISRRFISFTFFGMAFFSLAAGVLRPPPLPLEDPLLSTLLAAVICGVGSGMVLRSIGSAGGIDILAIYLNKRFGVQVGSILFAANAMVIIAGAYLHDLALSLYSLIFLFASSQVINKVVSGFNTRKQVVIVSRQPEAIRELILHRIGRGVTLFEAKGGYSGEPKRVLLTITTLTELPRLKEGIISIDPNALVVINDTLEVIGNRLGVIKQY
jgi:uncharacterized membrane-anchored protein YitT (DUF2179 family)